MTNTKLVSAIITTHNRSELLRRAVESVFAQTYSPIELIVVDDHSEDDTSVVCQDSRIKYFYIPKGESRGGNYARNLGIKGSKGNYCAFLDDDDYWLPTKIERQVALIEERNACMVSCQKRNELISVDGAVLTEPRSMLGKGRDMKRGILYNICTTTSLMLVRRDALISVGLFDENLWFWQEYELSIRLAQLTPFYEVNEPLVVYRVDKKDPNRLTNKFFEWQSSVKYIYKKHQTLYSKLSFKERLLVKKLYWLDGKTRAGAAVLKIQWYRCRIHL